MLRFFLPILLFSATAIAAYDPAPHAPSIGGTGATGVPTNGQIPIGNGSVYVPAVITPGSGISVTNGSGTISIAATGGGTASASSYDAQNLGLAASVATNAMTIALKQADGSTNPAAGASAVTIGFRSSTAATGAYSTVTATAATSVVIPSGATLGTTSGAQSTIFVYAISNAGTVELAVSSSEFVDQGSLYSTTAISAASLSSGVLYSTTARTSVPIRLIGRVKSTQTTAGTWATTPSEISVLPFQNFVRSQVLLLDGNSYGSGANNSVLNFATIQTQTGQDLTAVLSSSTGALITVNTPGLYSVKLSFGFAATSGWAAVTLNSSVLSTGSGIQNITYAQGLRCPLFSPASGASGHCSTDLYLVAGDILRAEAAAGTTTNGATSGVFFQVTKLSN